MKIKKVDQLTFAISLSAIILSIGIAVALTKASSISAHFSDNQSFWFSITSKGDSKDTQTKKQSHLSSE